MLLLQIPTFFDRAVEVSSTVSDQWSETWSLFLGSPEAGGTFGASMLFNLLTYLGLTFAGGSFLLYMYQTGQEVYSKKGSSIEPKIFIRPLVIAILLFNNGFLLRGTVVGVHQSLNEINSQVLRVVHTGVELDRAYNTVKNIGSVQNSINGFVGECAGTMGEQQVQCLENALDRSISVVEQARRSGDAGWFQQILSDLNELKNNILEDSVPFFIADDIFWAVAGPVWEQVAYGMLWAWQSGFQHSVETVTLFVAIFSPLAVGGGLVPTSGPGSVGLYFTGIIAVHLLKLAFNIMTGIAAIFFINGEVGDPLIFPIITAICAPFFSVLIMTGGAMGLWMGMVSLGEKGLQLGLRAIP